MILCAGLLAIGALALAFAPRIYLANFEHVRLDHLICGTCFFVSALAGIFGTISLRGAVRDLSQIRRI